MYEQMFQEMRKIQQAVLSARARTCDKTIGTRVSKGKFQVIKTTYAKNGISTVTPVSAFVSKESVIEILNSIK